MNKFKLLAMSLVLMSCGHTMTRQVGMMSAGDIEGKLIPKDAKGKLVQGKSCGYEHYLSSAFRDALKETQYDTILNATVTTETGLLVASNCLTISGEAFDSREWKKQEGKL